MCSYFQFQPKVINKFMLSMEKLEGFGFVFQIHNIYQLELGKFLYFGKEKNILFIIRYEL